MRNAAWILAAAILLPVTAAAQKPPTGPPRTPSDPTPRGAQPPRNRAPIMGTVYVGENAPDFELDGTQGRPVKLSSLRGEWTLLAFAERKEQVAALRDIKDMIASHGARVVVVGVCHEKIGSLRSFVQRDSVPFLMLADVTGEISASYGLYDREMWQARPGYLMLDRKGVVRMAVLGQLLKPQDVARLVQYTITGI